MILTIPKGKHTAYTLNRAILRVTPVCARKLRNKNLRIEGKFLSAPYDTQGDKDLRFDWSKFGGLNLNLFKEANINSIMLAFRANDEDNVWELGLYSNKNSKIIFPDGIVSVAKDELFALEIDQIDDYTYVAGLFMREGESEVLVLESEFKFDKKLSIGGIIGPYHGGKDDNNNGLGGPAPEDVVMEFNYKFV